MIRRPPRSTRTDTLFPYPTLFRSSHFARSSENLRPFPHYGRLDPVRSPSLLAWSARGNGIAVESRHHYPQIFPEPYSARLCSPGSPVSLRWGIHRVFRPRSSEERRVGKEFVSTCRSRGSPEH